MKRISTVGGEKRFLTHHVKKDESTEVAGGLLRTVSVRNNADPQRRWGEKWILVDFFSCPEVR